MDRLQCMNIFVQVADTGNFSKVAREQGLSTSVVSKSVGRWRPGRRGWKPPSPGFEPFPKPLTGSHPPTNFNSSPLYVIITE